MNINNLLIREYEQVYNYLIIKLVGGKDKIFSYYSSERTRYKIAQNINIVEVQGIYQRKSYTFQEDIDYEIEEDEKGYKIIRWINPPDKGSLFCVLYFEKEKEIKDISDIRVGSVARTLCEAIAYEISLFYKYLHLTYDSGFISTAKNKALDKIADMVGISRIGGKKENRYIYGKVKFIKEENTEGKITIPKRTLLLTNKNTPFITLENIEISEEENEVEVRSENEEEEDEKLKEIITKIPISIVGIKGIKQIGVLYRREEKESDESLRERCRNALKTIGKCTKTAIQYELIKAGAQEVKVYTPENNEKLAKEIKEIKEQNKELVELIEILSKKYSKRYNEVFNIIKEIIEIFNTILLKREAIIKEKKDILNNLLKKFKEIKKVDTEIIKFIKKYLKDTPKKHSKKHSSLDNIIDKIFDIIILLLKGIRGESLNKSLLKELKEKLNNIDKSKIKEIKLSNLRNFIPVLKELFPILSRRKDEKLLLNGEIIVVSKFKEEENIEMKLRKRLLEVKAAGIISYFLKAYKKEIELKIKLYKEIRNKDEIQEKIKKYIKEFFKNIKIGEVPDLERLEIELKFYYKEIKNIIYEKEKIYNQIRFYEYYSIEDNGINFLS